MFVLPWLYHELVKHYAMILSVTTVETHALMPGDFVVAEDMLTHVKDVDKHAKPKTGFRKSFIRTVAKAKAGIVGTFTSSKTKGTDSILFMVTAPRDSQDTAIIFKTTTAHV